MNRLYLAKSLNVINLLGQILSLAKSENIVDLEGMINLQLKKNSLFRRKFCKNRPFIC